MSLCSTQFTGLVFLDSSNITTTEGRAIISRSTVQSSNFQFLKTDIIFDNVVFTNITSTDPMQSSSQNSILVLRANQIRIQNSAFQMNSVDRAHSLLDIDSADDVNISNCTIKDNSGDSETSSIITITNSNQVRFRKIRLLNNDNILISLQGKSSSLIKSKATQNFTVDGLDFIESVNTTLQVDTMNSRMLNILIEHDTDKDRPIVKLHECEADFEVGSLL